MLQPMGSGVAKRGIRQRLCNEREMDREIGNSETEKQIGQRNTEMWRLRGR